MRNTSDSLAPRGAVWLIVALAAPALGAAAHHDRPERRAYGNSPP
ncbi:hypothetical protein [Kocuria sp. UBA1838]|nr:hypothetical protein [Kocuria sp. UBA1838]